MIMVRDSSPFVVVQIRAGSLYPMQQQPQQQGRCDPDTIPSHKFQNSNQTLWLLQLYISKPNRYSIGPIHRGAAKIFKSHPHVISPSFQKMVQLIFPFSSSLCWYPNLTQQLAPSNFNRLLRFICQQMTSLYRSYQNVERLKIFLIAEHHQTPQ